MAPWPGGIVPFARAESMSQGVGDPRSPALVLLGLSRAVLGETAAPSARTRGETVRGGQSLAGHSSWVPFPPLERSLLEWLEQSPRARTPGSHPSLRGEIPSSLRLCFALARGLPERCCNAV